MNEPPLHRFMNIITNIMYEIEQPIITHTFKEVFSISDHLPMFTIFVNDTKV